MEAALRTSPHDPTRFLIVSVTNSRLRLCEVASTHNESINHKNRIRINQTALRDKLPHYSAFDWSKTNEDLVAVGTQSGEAVIVNLAGETGGVGSATARGGRGGYVGRASGAAAEDSRDWMTTFKIHQQRKCNSIAWSTKGFLATGLERVRNGHSLHVYDVGSGNFRGSPANSPGESRGPAAKDDPEPYRKLASSEAIVSVKFIANEPDVLIGGIGRQAVRVFDLRESGSAGVAQFPTRQTHNIAIDPLDDHYFVSAAPSQDPVVSVWDRRFASRASPGTPSDLQQSGAVLELRPAADNIRQNTSLWSLRYSGTKRGSFGILTNTGELKIVDVAGHPPKDANPHSQPLSYVGGNNWSHPVYVKATHNLARPWYDEQHPIQESDRIMAFDFVTPGDHFDDDCILAMYQDRTVELMKMPDTPANVHVTAANELYRNLTAVAKPRMTVRKIADDLADLQVAVFGTGLESSEGRIQNSLVSEAETLSMQVHGLSMMNSSYTSREAHDQLLTMSFPEIRLQNRDLLTLLDTPKRRCQEGYLFDWKKNKTIIANDPWLIELWDLIGRLDDMKADDGMVANGLDLSYFGVYSLWKNSLRKKPNFNRLLNVEPPNDASFANAVKEIVKKQGYPHVLDVDSRWTEQRKLCLAVCGWALSKQTLKDLSSRQVDQGQVYKPIVLAVFKGHRDVALDLLKQAVRQKQVQNISLGAIIAGSTINDEQRSLCSWIAEETFDPYLKALLTYYIEGSYKSVVEMPQLALVDRVGIALAYLDDFSLSRFIESATADAIAHGDIEGVVLTGLDTPALDLFQSYITRFGDSQTAVLALARTHPLYSDDARWPLWLETYLQQMHTWHLFLPRSQFIAQHNLLAVTRRGRSLNPTPSPQVTIRCMNCQQAIARNTPTPRNASMTDLAKPLNPLHKGPGTLLNAPLPSTTTIAATTTSSDPSTPAPTSASFKPPRNPLRSPAAQAGTLCTKCGAPMPRCAICMMWLGTPDVSKPGGSTLLASAAPSGTGAGLPYGGTAVGGDGAGRRGEEEEEDALRGLMTLCLGCGHGFHGHHAREWFRRQRMCPVPDCGCMCGVGR